jgi:hypothetical protein
MIQSGRWNYFPDWEDQLPDDCMPQAFFDYWSWEPEPAEPQRALEKWQEIKSAVEKNGHVLTFTMEWLLDACGVRNPNGFVRAEISDQLAGLGLGHVPRELPGLPHESVRLYQKGTPVGELIDAVLTPGEQTDGRLREQFGG